MKYLIVFPILIVTIVGCTAQPLVTTSLTLDTVRPIAEQLFTKFAAKNAEQLDQGPCLGVIEQQWAIDIAHSPRTIADHDPKNQCAAFRTGQAKHLIEFSPQWEIITIK